MKKIILLFVIALSITACKKPKDGEPGATGPQGQQGTQGTQGNANVKSSNYTASSVFDWSKNTSGTLYTYYITNNDITYDIIDKGAVIVYWKIGSDLLAMPFTLNHVQFNYSVSAYDVEVNISGDNGQVLNNPYSTFGNMTFKVAVIAGERKSKPILKIID